MDILATILILLIAAFSGAAFIVDTTTGILGFAFASIFMVAMMSRKERESHAKK